MKHQFKPFDQVLVRDSLQGTWHTDFYSHYDHNNDRHQCMSSFWEQCIPYNENTANLVGTNKPYKEPEPKVWNVKDLDTGVHYEFTQNQFEHFMHDTLGSKKCGGYLIHRIN